MKTITTMIIIAVIAVKVIFAAVDNIAPQVQSANDRIDNVVAQATE